MSLHGSPRVTAGWWLSSLPSRDSGGHSEAERHADADPHADMASVGSDTGSYRHADGASDGYRTRSG